MLIFFTSAIAHADTNWVLKKDLDGIKVYTGDMPGSKLKIVRVTCTLNARLSQLASLLLDIPAHEQWVYNTKTSYVVKQLAEGHLIYYSEISMPNPLGNRDVVVDLHITQQPATKVMSVIANAIEQYVPVKKDKVRITLSKVSWTVTPIGKDQISIEYTAQADPGGSLPAWTVNLFTTKGPFETFKKLKELIASPIYQNAHIDFIKD